MEDSAAGAPTRAPPRFRSIPSGLHPRAGAKRAAVMAPSSRRGVRDAQAWTPHVRLPRRAACAARRCPQRTARGSVRDRTNSTHQGSLRRASLGCPVVLILLLTASGIAAPPAAQHVRVAATRRRPARSAGRLALPHADAARSFAGRSPGVLLTRLHVGLPGHCGLGPAASRLLTVVPLLPPTPSVPLSSPLVPGSPGEVPARDAGFLLGASVGTQAARQRR